MDDFNDYTPKEAVEEIESRTGIKVGRKILYSILRMKNIISDNYSVIDKDEYGKYFYFKIVKKARITFTLMPESPKLFVTERGIKYVISNIQEWLKEHNAKPKKKRGKKINYVFEG